MTEDTGATAQPRWRVWGPVVNYLVSVARFGDDGVPEGPMFPTSQGAAPEALAILNALEAELKALREYKALADRYRRIHSLFETKDIDDDYDALTPPETQEAQ